MIWDQLQTMQNFSLKFVKITSNISINFDPPKRKCHWMTLDFRMKTSSFSETEEVWKPVRVVSLVSNSFSNQIKPKIHCQNTKVHIPPNGKLGKSSTQKCQKGGGTLDITQRYFEKKTNHVIQFARGSNLGLAQPWLIIMIHHSLSKARQFTSKWQCCVEPSSEYRRRNGWCPTTPDLCMHLQKHHWFFRSYHWKRLEKGFWMGNMTIISRHAGKFIASQDGEMEKRLRLFWGSLTSGPRSTMIWFGKIIRSTKIQTKWIDLHSNPGTNIMVNNRT